MAFQLIAILVATFFTDDVLKGIVGLSLPSVNIALFCTTLDISAEMVLLLAPSLRSNLWLSFSSASPLQFFKRLWPIYCSSSISFALGLYAFTILDAEFAEQVLLFRKCSY